MSNRVNDPGTFNQSRELFGLNENNLDREARTIARRFFPQTGEESRDAKATSGRVQRQMGAVVSDFDAPLTKTAAPDPVEPREQFSGSFAMVRAASILHQYDVNYWDQNAVVRYVSASEVPAPSSPELDAKYNDFLAFSYVPDQMVPSATVFRSLANPQARAAFVGAQLPAAGVNTTPTPNAPVVDPVEDTTLQTFLVPLPFAENLQSSCAGQNYFAKSTGPVVTRSLA